MNDTRDELERATRSAPVAPPDVGRLYSRRDAKKRRSRVSAAAVAVAVAVGGTSLAMHAIGGSGGHVGSAAAAQIGAPTQNLSLNPGDYYFLRFDGGWGVCESWWALDDSGRLDTVQNQSSQGNCWGPPGGKTYGPGEFYSDTGPVAGLSTDPDELVAQLRDRVQPGGASPEPYAGWGGPIEWGLIRSIGELLEAPDVTPQQKAALMIVAGELSTSVDMHARDPEGRPAILLTLDSEHQIHEWWFDPESHQPLDLEGVLVQAAGVVSTTTSSDLNRSFVPEIKP
jgi:hypothetical protein